MSSRRMSLLPRATLHSDSEQYVTKCKYVIITKHELEGVTSLYVAMGQISAGTGSLVTLYEDDI